MIHVYSHSNNLWVDGICWLNPTWQQRSRHRFWQQRSFWPALVLEWNTRSSLTCLFFETSEIDCEMSLSIGFAPLYLNIAVEHLLPYGWLKDRAIGIRWSQDQKLHVVPWDDMEKFYSFDPLGRCLGAKRMRVIELYREKAALPLPEKLYGCEVVITCHEFRRKRWPLPERLYSAQVAISDTWVPMAAPEGQPDNAMATFFCAARTTAEALEKARTRVLELREAVGGTGWTPGDVTHA